MNIVMTGATSFIGSHVLSCLLKEPQNRIWVIIRPNSKNINKIVAHKNVSIVKLDVLEIENLCRYVQRKIDVFFHFAWEGVRLPYRDDKDVQDKNYSAALKAMKVCEQLGCCKFIGCGSQAEYGDMEGVIDENYLCKPNTAYGKAKLKSYEDLYIYAERHDIDFIWARIFSVYGPGDYDGSLIMSCIDKMSRNQSVQLTECRQEWDYIYVDEVAELFVRLAMEKCKSGVYNIASGKHRILKEYLEEMKALMDSHSELEFGKIPYPESGMVSFIPDVQKIQNELNWKSAITFEEGIKNILRGKTNAKSKYCRTNV